jgi:rare lipoprotein A (peptidoglycan hydrolase)
MSRTLANKTPLAAVAAALTMTVTVMLAWAGPAAFASSGGASAPANAPTRAHAKSAHARTTHGAQIATWFGPGFYGQTTACGQTMTPAIVGVASRTLPCGTLVLVNYGGHRLTVPVIDRGPYASNGAVWDLTWGAASALTITDTVRIRTKIVGRATNTPLLGTPAPSPLTAMEAASGGTAAA